MTDLFFRNRRLLVLAILLIVVAGVSSYRILPRMEDPYLTPRFAIVATRLPGANALRVESLVTEKIEEELRDVEEIKEFRSVSRSGASTIIVELRDDVFEVETVWSDVRTRLDDAIGQMPKEATKPTFDELNARAYALLIALKWSRDDAPNYAILRRLTEQLKTKLIWCPAQNGLIHSVNRTRKSRSPLNRLDCLRSA